MSHDVEALFLVHLLHWLLVLPLGLLGYHAIAVFGGQVVSRADRGVRAPFDRQMTALLLRESVARSLTSLLGLIGWIRGRPGLPKRFPDDPVPVLFVSGVHRSRASLWFMQLFVRQRGYTHTRCVGHSHADRTLAELAAELGNEVMRFKAETDAERIHIVGHSAGALVAAWWVRHLDGAEHVQRLVCIGGPFAGTRMAVFGRSKASGQLLPRSPTLDDLAPCPVSTTCIWSPDDPVVVPAESAILPGAESVRIDGSGHVDLLFSSRCCRAVLAALGAAGESR